MGNNNLQNTEKTLRSIAKRYDNVKYSIGLAVLFLMKGTSAFSDANVIQEVEKQKDILTDVKKEKAEVKEVKKEVKTSQKLKASWANMQFGANDMYSNLFAMPKTKVDTTSVVKSEKTVLVASADNDASLPMFAKLLSDIEETTDNRTATLATIAKKEEELGTKNVETIDPKDVRNLRDSVDNLQNKIERARRENSKEINGLRLELIQLMEQGNQVVKSPWASWQFGMNYFYDDWGGAYKGRGDKKEKYPFEGIFTRSNGNERYISTSSKQYSNLTMSDDITSASTNRRANLKRGYGLTEIKPTEEPIVAFDVNAGVKPKQVSKGAITIADKNPIAPEQPEAILFKKPEISVVAPTPPSINATVLSITPPSVTGPTVNEPGLPPIISFVVSKPAITVPTLTTPSVTLPSPPVTGNWDATWITKNGSVGAFHQVSVDGGTIDVNGTGDTYDISVNSSKLTGISGSGGGKTYYNNISGTPTNATSVTATAGVTAATQPNLTFSLLGNSVTTPTYYPAFAAMKLVGGQRIDLDNVTINFAGTGPTGANAYKRWLFHTDGHNDFGDSTWVIGENSKVNITGNNLIMYTSQYHGSAPTNGHVGFVNKGEISTSATSSENILWYSMSDGNSGPNRAMYFDNQGKIKLEGIKNTFAIINSENSSGDGWFSVQNNDKIDLAGDKITGITFGKDYDISEILLNKPITITGTNSTGVYFNQDVDLEGGKTVTKSTSDNVVTELPGTTRESILNVDITAGTKNSGLFFDAYDENNTTANIKVLDVPNATINLSSANGSNAGIYAKAGTVNLAKDNTNVNLIGGQNNVGIYVDNGEAKDNNGATIKVELNAEGKVNITGGTGGIGILSTGNSTSGTTATNTGVVTITAKDNVGMVAANKAGSTVTGEINQEGTVLVNAKESIGVAAVGTGAIANIKANSTTKAGDSGAAAGTASGASALFADDGGKVLAVTGATIESANGGVGAYATSKTGGGAGTIDFNGATINTKIRGLSFMADGTGSKINFSGNTTGNIDNYGTVFYLKPVNTASSITDTANFNTTASILPAFTAMINNYFSNLNNLTLNMNDKSNMVVTSYISGNVSDLTFDDTTAFGGAGRPTINGDYKAFLLDKSNVTVDVDSDLDTTSTGTAAAYRRIALSNSTITNNKKISGTQSGLVAMAQQDETTDGWVTLTNSSGASIELAGDKSVAIYGSNGKIVNAGDIKVGDRGVAIFGDNAGYGDSDISNTGTITIGSEATGIYAKNYTTKDVKNNGTITINGSKSSGMAFAPGNLAGTTTVFENVATIQDKNSGSNNTGMFAKKATIGAYDTINSGTITLGDSSSLGNPSVGMYTNTSVTGTNPLKNIGTIKVGKNGIGLYGYEETTTGNITVGDSGIALYSQGGDVNIGSSTTNPTIKVGDTNATAVYTTGSGQTVTSTKASYDIGTGSYGFVNVNSGTGNTINISGGTATLKDKGLFIYSNDKNGTITNSNPISSTGTIGSNTGIYSTGTVTNSGDISFTGGTGNVGVYVIDNGTITNSGKINVGASTTANRSIGAVANTGTINNTGNIVVNGQYGLGLYSTGATSTINNGANITLTGDETIGAYGANGSNINLTSGTIASTGNKTTGYYLGGGTASTIASGAKINVTGNEANGVYVNSGANLTYTGETKVTGDAAYGLIVDGASTVNATGGKVTIGGTSGINGSSSGANSNRGAAGLVVKSGSTLSGNALDLTADVSGENSIGVYSAGSLAINSANVSAYDSAVNFFTEGGTLSIGNNGGTSTVLTGTGADKGALMFYTPSGNILLNGPVNATVQGSTDTLKRGTAFYYTGGGTLGTISSYTQLNPTTMASWARNHFGNGTTSTLGNLNLTMNQDSRLFLTEQVDVALSNTSATSLFSGLSSTERPNVTGAGSGYRTFMLYHSHLNVDNAVNLDNANDPYNLMEISSSSITNNSTITGTQAGQIALAQANDTTPKSVVTLTNNGTITLSGANSAGIFAKNGIVKNTNDITVGNSSSGIYGLNNTEISNTGTITTGGSSTGIFYSDVEKDSAGNVTAINNTTTGLKNDGTINLNGDDSVALTYEPGNITSAVVFENAGDISSTGDKNVGMYAKLAKNNAAYTTKNTGNITLGNSASLSNPNVAMYTNATSTGTNPLINVGNITVGDNAVGMYGYEENSTGNITVGNGSIAMYSKGGNVNVAGSITTGNSGESVGVYTVGNGQTITNNGATFNLGDTAFGFVNVGSGNNITSNGGSATLNNDGVFIYSSDKANTINNSTNISSTGSIGKNYGIYASGTVNNSGNMNLSNGVGNLGIYITNGGTGRNSGNITVGASDDPNGFYSIGMAAGYVGDSTNPATTATTGTIENNGTITVTGEKGIGMYGANTGTTVTNNNNIVLNANNTMGIYVENGAKAVNNGSIRTGVSGLSSVIGVVLGQNSILENNGTINISGTQSKGVLLKGGRIDNYGNITVSGAGSKEKDSLNSSPTSKQVGSVVINAPAGATTATITAGGVVQTPTVVNTTARNPISVAADSIGLYVNTSGTHFTNSITGLGNLTTNADLIIGTEAAQSTRSRYILVNDNRILNPYNTAILTSGVSKWDIYSGSLTWMTTPTLNKTTGAITNLYMAKIPYTEWANDRDTYNFTDGLEQRYGVEELGTRENKVFQKLNSIGNNEETLLYQAYDEMMGHQYANVQQRIQATGDILNKEFNYLRSEWQTVSKDSNKVKVFGARGEYSTDTAGVIDYKNNAYGVAYVHEDETVRLGEGTGWYAGIVNNTFKFKDIGNSKEEQLQGKVGIFKSIPFDHNNSLNWTISGDIFAGYNKINRRFLVVDEVFSAKGRYHTYGVGLKNEVSKEFRLSESFTLKPYAALGLEYGRVSKIREKSGEIKLDVKSNDYFSVRPEVGAELGFKHHFDRKTVRVGVSVAYENELGRVANGKNKAKVAGTDADYFNIRGEKEDRRGNVKTDLNIGVDNQRIGVTANVGYDTKGNNVRAGVGLRVIF